MWPAKQQLGGNLFFLKALKITVNMRAETLAKMSTLNLLHKFFQHLEDWEVKGSQMTHVTAWIHPILTQRWVGKQTG